MTNVMERVKKHYDRVVKLYGSNAVLGVFCYGSWNYNTALENSDVDTKCILVPDIWHLAIKPYEVKHIDVDGEVCECMSIMHMVNNWKKQNINFVEIMFTDYCIINPVYQEMWNTCFPRGVREEVARYDLAAAVRSMSHQAIHTIKQDPADLKKIMNTARIANSLARLVTYKDMSYKRIIWQPDSVRGIRTNETPVPINFVEDMIIYFEAMIEKSEKMESDSDVKEKLDNFLNDCIEDLIYYRINEL